MRFFAAPSNVVFIISLVALVGSIGLAVYVFVMRRRIKASLGDMQRRVDDAKRRLAVAELDVRTAGDNNDGLRRTVERFATQIKEIEQTVRAIPQAPAETSGVPRRPPAAALYTVAPDDHSFGSTDWMSPGPSLSTGYSRARAAGTPVDFNGHELILSDALEPVGLLVTDGTASGSAELYINENVALNNMAFDRWGQLFEFRSGGAFQRFRTARPCIVDWDSSNRRGLLKSKGMAEVLP
jgi:hypothetical protein